MYFVAAHVPDVASFCATGAKVEVAIERQASGARRENSLGVFNETSLLGRSSKRIAFCGRVRSLSGTFCHATLLFFFASTLGNRSR